MILQDTPRRRRSMANESPTGPAREFRALPDQHSQDGFRPRTTLPELSGFVQSDSGQAFQKRAHCHDQLIRVARVDFARGLSLYNEPLQHAQERSLLPADPVTKPLRGCRRTPNVIEKHVRLRPFLPAFDQSRNQEREAIGGLSRHSLEMPQIRATGP